MHRLCCRCSDDLKIQKSSIIFACDAFYAVPAIINISFACELYLKAICLIKNIKFGKIHSLIKLFELLSDEDRQALKEKYNLSKNNTMTFEEVLEIHSKSFETWRYAYEKNNQNVVAYIDNLQLATETLRDYLLDIKESK